MRSFLIDVVPLCSIAIVSLLIFINTLAPDMSTQEEVLFNIPEALGLIAFAIWNSGYLQGTTGLASGSSASVTPRR